MARGAAGFDRRAEIQPFCQAAGAEAPGDWGTGRRISEETAPKRFPPLRRLCSLIRLRRQAAAPDGAPVVSVFRAAGRSGRRVDQEKQAPLIHDPVASRTNRLAF